jgi:hypothetical protein
VRPRNERSQADADTAPRLLWDGDLDARFVEVTSHDVVDPGIRASELSHPAPSFGDYNRDGTVDITHLGIWAGGLGRGCADGN